MATQKLRSLIVWVLGFCLLTALSTLFDSLWRSVGGYLLQFLSWYWQSLADSVCAAAAKEPIGIPAFATALLFYAMLVPVAAMCAYFSNPEPGTRALGFLLGENPPKPGPLGRGFFRAMKVVSLFLLLLVTLGLPLDMLSRTIRQDFHRAVIYYGPCLSTSEERALRSRFVVMHTEKEYVAIMNAMQGLAQERGFPVFPESGS